MANKLNRRISERPRKLSSSNIVAIFSIESNREQDNRLERCVTSRYVFTRQSTINKLRNNLCTETSGHKRSSDHKAAYLRAWPLCVH